MKVLYVLKRYPRLSETFVVREILGIEAVGVTVLIDALLPPEDEPRHADLDHVRAAVRYLSRRPARTDGVLTASFWLALKRPRVVLREARAARDRFRAGDRRALRYWRQSLLVARRAQKAGVTQVHCHFATAAAQVALPAAAMAGVPCSITAHAKDIFHRDNAPTLRERIAAAQAVVTVSAFNVDHLRGVVGTNAAAKIHHIANGVPLGPANEHTVGQASSPVLCVSRLVPKKGIDTLIEAVSLLASDDPTLRLDLIGSGPLIEDLHTLARELGVSDRVRFLGAQTSAQVEEAYSRCSLVALPCRIDGDGDRDGLPTVLVEALGRAVPVISTNVVGIPELVRHGNTGLLIDPDDAPALAAAITKLRSDPEFARSMGAAGRELVAQAYDPATSARALRDLWQGLAR